VPNVFSCTQSEEVQARSFRKKGYNESSKTQETKLYGLKNHRGRVYNIERAKQYGFTKLLIDLLDHEMDPMMMTKSRV
jgi:hypothetical protein